MAKGIPAGQASFTLKLNDQLTGKLQKIGMTVRNGMKRIGSAAKAGAMIAAKALAAIGTAAIAAGVAIVKLGKQFAAYGDKFGKMATRTRIGAEALQELSFAAQISGTNIDSLSQALFRARRRIGNMAIGGGGPAARALETLGLNAKELAKEQPEKQFFKLISALKAVGNEAERNQLAFEIFGDNFRDIQPLIDAGADSIDNLRDRANRLGLVLSSREIRQAEELTDAFFEFGEVAKMAAIKIGAAFGPSLKVIFTGLAEAIADLSKMFEDLGGGITIIGQQIKFAMTDIYAKMFEQLEPIFKMLPTRMRAMFAPIMSALKAGRSKAFRDLTEAIKDTAGDAGKIVFTDSGSFQPGAPTGVRPEPVATTGILSGFAAQYAAAFGFNRADPKKEEKQMVNLLEEIADAGPLAVQPG